MLFCRAQGTHTGAAFRSAGYTDGPWWRRRTRSQKTTQMSQLRRCHNLVPCHRCWVRSCKKKGHSRQPSLQHCPSWITTCQSQSSLKMLTHWLTGEPIKITFLLSPVLQELTCLHPPQVWTVSTCSVLHPTSWMIEEAGFQPVELRCSSLLEGICHWCINRHRHLCSLSNIAAS